MCCYYWQKNGGAMRKYRSYKFTDKHHSKGGIRSSIAGGISLLCTLGSVYGAFAAKGNAGNYLVIPAAIAIVGCCCGVVLGNRSFKEEECYYLFSRIGTGVNLLLVIFWIAVVGMGCLI